MISLLNLYDQPQDPIVVEGLPTELQKAFFGPEAVLPNEPTGQGVDDWIETEYQIAWFGPDRKPDKFGAAAFYPDHVLGPETLRVDQQVAFFSLGLPLPNEPTGQSEDNWLDIEQQVAWFGPLFQPTPVSTVFFNVEYAQRSIAFFMPDTPIVQPILPPKKPVPGPGNAQTVGGGGEAGLWQRDDAARLRAQERVREMQAQAQQAQEMARRAQERAAFEAIDWSAFERAEATRRAAPPEIEPIRTPAPQPEIKIVTPNYAPHFAAQAIQDYNARAMQAAIVPPALMVATPKTPGVAKLGTVALGVGFAVAVVAGVATASAKIAAWFAPPVEPPRKRKNGDKKKKRKPKKR